MATPQHHETFTRFLLERDSRTVHRDLAGDTLREFADADADSIEDPMDRDTHRAVGVGHDEGDWCPGAARSSEAGRETAEPSQVYLGGISPPGPNAGLRSLKALTDTPDPVVYSYLARNPVETAGHKYARHGCCGAPPVCLVVTGVAKTQSMRRCSCPRVSQSSCALSTDFPGVCRSIQASFFQSIGVGQ